MLFVQAFGLWQLQPTKKIIVCGVALTELTEEEDDDDDTILQSEAGSFWELETTQEERF